MTIDTKYNVTDYVFGMTKNIVVELKIESIGVDSFSDNINYPIEDHIYYNCSNSLKEVVKFYQKSLFPTKEALLQSL